MFTKLSGGESKSEGNKRKDFIPLIVFNIIYVNKFYGLRYKFVLHFKIIALREV